MKRRKRSLVKVIKNYIKGMASILCLDPRTSLLYEDREKLNKKISKSLDKYRMGYNSLGRYLRKHK